jgi:hypothetical protein
MSVLPIKRRRVSTEQIKEEKPIGRIAKYRQGAEGFISWCNENVRIKIYPEGSDIAQWCPMSELPDTPNPETGRSYRDMWLFQQDLVREALKMENGRFIYRLLVFCWMRGEGKSLLACLIQLWKFFCWPKQDIVLGANSKDQIKFVHFDVMSDIVQHSPELLKIVKQRNVQQKSIQIKDNSGRVVSTIRALSSFSGIVSNITGYTFSEMFSMKNPKFFVELDGSIRTISNALGVIDSTVSPKQHPLYTMWKDKVENKPGTEGIFYSYRYSETGDNKDWWNPNMTQKELEGYRIKFPFGEFEKFFKNLWSAGKIRIFTDEMIEAISIYTVDGALGCQNTLIELLEEKHRILKQISDLGMRNVDALASNESLLDDIEKRFGRIAKIYQMQDAWNSRPATIEELNKLGTLYDTNWSILVGIDRADPMKTRSSARTMVTCLAKGLPGSKSNPFQFYGEENVPNYLYIRLHLADVTDHSLEGIKELLNQYHVEYDGIDSIGGERWGLWDLAPWAEERNISFDLLFPTYDRQRSAFGEFYSSVSKGLFKSAPTGIPGSKSSDIQIEEMELFDHDAQIKWFGSPEKEEKGGVQDDSIFATGWSMYSGRNLGVENFKERGSTSLIFGIFIQEKDVLGKY